MTIEEIDCIITLESEDQDLQLNMTINYIGGINIIKKILLIILRILSIPYAYSVIAVTLIHRYFTHTHNIKPPFWEIVELWKGNEEILFDISANIIMFIPLGFFLPICFRKADNIKKIALIGFLVSLSIEIIQLITTLGFFEIDDMFHNTLGTMLGALIGCPLSRWLYSELKEKDTKN